MTLTGLYGLKIRKAVLVLTGCSATASHMTQPAEQQQQGDTHRRDQANLRGWFHDQWFGVEVFFGNAIALHGFSTPWN